MRSICSALVSGFLTMVVQQIHSLRWIGVRPFHLASIFASEANAFAISDGTLCTTPTAISFLLIIFFGNKLLCKIQLPRNAISVADPRELFAESIVIKRHHHTATFRELCVERVYFRLAFT